MMMRSTRDNLFGDEGDDWTTIIFMKMHFGDQPMATGLKVAKEIADEEGKAINADTASKMMKGGYIDNPILGGTAEEYAKMKEKVHYCKQSTLNNTFRLLIISSV